MENLSGKRFGKLVALRQVEPPAGTTKTYFECQCDCGALRSYPGTRLKRGMVESCGKKPCKKTRLIDLTGQRFGRLVVVQRQGVNHRQQVLWECLCDCGVTTVIVSPRRGYSRSCGCLRREVVGKNSTTHGHFKGNNAGSPTYRSYVAAKNRCTNPQSKDWPNYGGRGIKFLFYSFPQWLKELGERPDGTTVDRIDNDGNYEPGNVRWATAETQVRGRKRDAKNQWEKEGKCVVIDFGV